MKNRADKPYYIFLFGAVYGYVGGIEQFNQQILKSWMRTSPEDRIDVLVQEDDYQTHRKNSVPHSNGNIRFFGFQHKFKIVTKLKMVFYFLWRSIFYSPSHIFVGHISWSFPALIISKLTGTPYSLMIHGSEVLGSIPLTRRLGLNQAGHIFVNSKDTQQKCISTYKTSKEKFFLLPPTTDEMFFTLKEKAKNTLQLNTPIKNENILLTVARLDARERHKGIDTTIRALPAILETVNIIYFVIGQGGDLKRLKDLVLSLDLEKKVFFLGALTNEEVRDYYHLADCYVMPSDEGFGIVYLEALLCGVPVVAGDADGSAEPLQGNKLGWRVNRKNPDQVAHAVLEALAGTDPRSNSKWLRDETIKVFGLNRFDERIRDVQKFFTTT
ncbi:MAG: glycosyltransferase [Bdellovibrionales bacterium]|nr:glycosyltransferase [Bdellovibrionales bacterium]